MHTHSDCSRNWVLILVWMEILWEQEGFQLGFKRWPGWAVSKVLWEWIPNVGSKTREGVKATSLAFVLLDFQHAGVRRRAYCTRQSVNMQQLREISRTRTTYSTETHTSDFILKTLWNGKPVQFFQERCWVVVTGVPREQVLQQSSEFSGETGWQNYVYPWDCCSSQAMRGYRK